MKNSEFPAGKLSSELVFLIVSIIDRGIRPAVSTADGGYLGLLLGGDGLLAIAPLEVKGLVEGGDEVGADGLRLRLGDVLVELHQAARHATFGIGLEVGALVGKDVGAVWIDDGNNGGIDRGVVAEDIVETVLMTAAPAIVAEHVVGGLLPQDLLVVR